MNLIKGAIGIISILLIAYLLSNNKKKINYNTIFWGLSLQMIFALFILKTKNGAYIFSLFDKAIKKIISFSDAGGDFLFQSFVPGVGFDVGLVNFAFRALPTIIFFSSLMAALYHIGIMQIIIKVIAQLMQKTMKTSGSETLAISSNIFVGQTEAPLLVKPFISKMTQSELMAIMTGGFATVAGGIMAVYVQMLSNIPNIAGHLLAASLMSAPAALVIAKIIYPENEKSVTFGNVNLNIKKTESNMMEAIAKGATDGLKLAANVAAMLIAFVSIIAMLNYFLSYINLSLEEILGTIFRPLAFLMGTSWDEAYTLGMLMGKKIVLTELVAYGELANLDISNKTAIIASYALCGFSNFASIGIQLGGIGGIAPERRSDLAKIALKAMFGGALASWLTATIAGILI